MHPARHFNPFAHLEGLLADFVRLQAVAQAMTSPNAVDDECIRCAMVGFPRHASLNRWDSGHYEYVRVLRDEVSDGNFSQDWRRFCCLAAGYFLGMAVAGLLDELELRLSEAQTPGFMWLHSESFGTAADPGGFE
jgi:hypothetical protein